MKNFKLVKKVKLKELNSWYQEYEHKELGTKVIWIKNKDKDRTFEIGFKTPPTNSKGINHILEHSVLRGSKKYPFIKEEVFAELAKKSVYTFLNAATYPDRTVYPFSSHNFVEYLKIMNVYLDAVLFPRVLEDKNIFRQEGWRYDIDENGKIFFNGVVFNEMKGRNSSIENILWNSLTKNLFSNTIWAVDTGGDPKEIIKLDYQELVDYHKKYYHPSNALIYFYGDIPNIEKALEGIQDEFLSKFKKKKINSKIKFEKNFKERKKIVEKFYSQNPKESILSFNFILGKNNNLEEVLENTLLRDILFLENSSELKKKLLNSGLVDRVEADFETELGQSFLNINLKGVERKNFAKLEKIFWEELERIAKNGISKELVQAKLDAIELNLNLLNLKTGNGLRIADQIFALWTYGVENIEEKFSWNEAIKSFREKLSQNENYLERLVKKRFLKNKNSLVLKLVADPKFNPEKELEKELKKINKKKDKKEILAEIEEFKKYQNLVEPEENLNLIKPISLTSFPKEIEEYSYEVLKNKKYIFTETKNKKIEVFSWAFDISHFNEKEYQNLKVILDLISKGKFKTKKYSQNEIEILLKKYFSKWTFNQLFFENKKGELRRIITFDFIILKKNLKKAFDFINEVLNNFILEEKDIKNYQKEKILNFKNSLAYGGIDLISSFAIAQLNQGKYLSEKIGSYSFYKFLKDEFDIEEVLNLKNIFNKKNLIISQLSSEKDLKIFDLIQLKSFESKAKKISFKEKKQNTVFILDSLMNSFNSLLIKIDFKEAWKFDIINNILRYDYLWKKIREEGGAYGGNAWYVNKTGELFSSYMDSRISGTYQDFENTISYLENLNLEKKEIENLVAKKLAEFLKPQSELDFSKRNLINELKGEKEREKIYKKIFNFKNYDFKKIAEELKKSKVKIKISLSNKKMIEKKKIIWWIDWVLIFSFFYKKMLLYKNMIKKIKSVGVIMDGNRRWAVENGMSKLDGHKYGADKLIELLDWVKEEGIEYLTVYTLSTENLKRTKIEVDLLFKLFEKMFLDRLDEIIQKEIRIKFVGKLSLFPEKLQKIFREAEQKTENFKTTLVVAAAYGGRLEIVEAVKKIVQEKKLEEIGGLSEEDFEKNIWTGELPEPELIIRTGGDHRLSNFLLWKASYSELFFTNTKWPAFSKEEFLDILDVYKNNVKVNKGK